MDGEATIATAESATTPNNADNLRFITTPSSRDNQNVVAALLQVEARCASVSLDARPSCGMAGFFETLDQEIGGPFRQDQGLQLRRPRPATVMIGAELWPNNQNIKL